MSILDKIQLVESFDKRIDEAQIRGLRNISKEYNKAKGYFHMDLDGVTSAIAMRELLANAGIKTVEVERIQYGGNEFRISKPKNGMMGWMVDFAHGKPFLTIHTDHHDAQSGVLKGQSTAFVKSPSNASIISAELSKRDLFPQRDLDVISTVDSADFVKNNVTPDMVMRAAFGVDKSISVERNHFMMGLVVNKLLLSYKNKAGFLEELVMKANPSLISIYNVIKKLAKDYGYKTPEEIGQGMGEYVTKQEANYVGDKVDPAKLKSGQNTMWGTCLVQYGGGSMFKGYDRYTPFKLHPEAEYMTIAWPLGLIQISKNPFKSGKNPYNLSTVAWDKVMSKHKSKLMGQKVTFGDVKRMYETDIKPSDSHPTGFTFEDLASLFTQDMVKGIDLEGIGSWNRFVDSVSRSQYKHLSRKQKDVLDKISVSVWDVMKAASGGHKDITNIQGFNFLGKGYVDFMKKVMKDIALEMQDKRLQ